MDNISGDTERTIGCNISLFRNEPQRLTNLYKKMNLTPEYII